MNNNYNDNNEEEEGKQGRKKTTNNQVASSLPPSRFRPLRLLRLHDQNRSFHRSAVLPIFCPPFFSP
jgi:hypothetical protein